MNTIGWIDSLAQDARYAFRALRRSPGFTAVAVLTLAVGIGVNAAVFTVTNAVLFKGFPLVEQNDRLLYMTRRAGCCVSYPDFLDWRAQAKSFTGMAIVHGVHRPHAIAAAFRRATMRPRSAPTLFAGRARSRCWAGISSPSDEMPGAPPVAILSYGFWERRYGKDPAVIGRAVRMNGAPTTVIGVMPRGFSFPQNAGFLGAAGADAASAASAKARNLWFAFGRLADGVTIESARAEMDTIGRRLARRVPAYQSGDSLRRSSQTFRSSSSARTRP